MLKCTSFHTIRSLNTLAFKSVMIDIICILVPSKLKGSYALSEGVIFALMPDFDC